MIERVRITLTAFTYTAPLINTLSENQIQILQHTQNIAEQRAIGAHVYVPTTLINEITLLPTLKERINDLTQRYLTRSSHPIIQELIIKERNKTFERIASPLFIATH